MVVFARCGAGRAGGGGGGGGGEIVVRLGTVIEAVLFARFVSIWSDFATAVSVACPAWVSEATITMFPADPRTGEVVQIAVQLTGRRVDRAAGAAVHGRRSDHGACRQRDDHVKMVGWCGCQVVDGEPLGDRPSRRDLRGRCRHARREIEWPRPPPPPPPPPAMPVTTDDCCEMVLLKPPVLLP